MGKRIILVDTTTWLGHHEPYFLAYTKVFLELGFEVTALCLDSNKVKESFPEAISNDRLKIASKTLPFYQRFLFKLARILSQLRLTGFSYSQLNALFRWQQIKNCTTENSYVFILDLQGYLCHLNSSLQKLLLPKRWAGLYVCPPKTEKLIEIGRDTIRHTSCQALGLLNEKIVEEMAQQVSHPKIIHLPDIADTRCASEFPQELLELKEKANGRKIVLLAGLSKRHGLLNLLKLAEAMKTDPILFCAIGLVNFKGYSEAEKEYIEDQLTHGAENLFVLRDYYPPEEVLNSFFQTADVAYLCQEGFIHSSNKFTKAIHLNTPVLVSQDTLLADRVQRYHLGRVVNPMNLLGTSEALRSLCNGFQFDTQLHQQFLKYYSKQNLYQKLSEIFN